MTSCFFYIVNIFTVKTLPYDETGKRTYERACKKLGVVPSSTCMKKLANVTTLDMKNYGLGPKGTMAVAIAMVVRKSSYVHTCIFISLN